MNLYNYVRMHLKQAAENTDDLAFPEKVGDAYKMVVGTRRYPLTSVDSEYKELLAARTPEEFNEELSDLAWTAQAYLHQDGHLPADMPTHGRSSIEKYIGRNRFMRNVLARHGVDKLDLEAFASGTNWAKPNKVDLVLRHHGIELPPEKLLGISQEYADSIGKKVEIPPGFG